MKRKKIVKWNLFLTFSVAIGFTLAIHAQPAKPGLNLKKVTKADSLYGQGGTLTEVTNGFAVVLAKTWKDKAGVIREIFLANFVDKDGTRYMRWQFYSADGERSIALLYYYPAKHTFSLKEFDTNEKGTLTSKANVSFAQAQEWVETFEKQFAAHGTVDPPWETQNDYVPAKLKPGEAFGTPKTQEKKATIFVVDKCIVGKWTALPSTGNGAIGEELIYRTGGLALTIEPDGATVFDFGKVPAFIRPNGDAIEEIRALGSRSANITTKSVVNIGTVMETTTDPKLNVTVRITNNKGLNFEDKPNVFFPMSMAYFGGNAGEQVDYICKGDSLVIARGGLTFRKLPD